MNPSEAELPLRRLQGLGGRGMNPLGGTVDLPGAALPRKNFPTPSQMARETLERWQRDAEGRQLFELVKAIELGLALSRGEYRLKGKNDG